MLSPRMAQACRTKGCAETAHSTLAFQPGQGDPAQEIALGEKENCDHRQGHERGCRHYHSHAFGCARDRDLHLKSVEGDHARLVRRDRPLGREEPEKTGQRGNQQDDFPR